jgi:hypothetical protein
MLKSRIKSITQRTDRILQFKRKFPQLLYGFILIVGMITLGIALLVYAYLGTFSRYYADDYCMSGLYLSAGFPRALVILFQTWSNRYAGMILVSISEMLGRSVIRYWTGITLAAWVPVLTWTLIQVGRLARLQVSKWMALVGAGVLVFFTVMESPQLYQTLFWRIGLITYTLPLVFMTLSAGMILNGVEKAKEGNLSRLQMILSLAGCFAIALFAGGFSETYVTLQTGILGLGFLVALAGVKSDPKRSWLLWLGISLAGSLIALLIVMSAPGNAVRLASMPTPPGILTLIRSSAKNAFFFLYISLRDYSFQTLLLFLLLMLVAYGFITSMPASMGLSPSQLVLTLMITPIIGYLLIVAICAPSVFAESSYPEPRALMEARFIMVLMVFIEGSLIGVGLGQLHRLSGEMPPFHLQVLLLLASFAILLYPLYDSWKMYAQVPEFRIRAVAWDERDATIRLEKAQGQENIIIQEFDAVSGIQEMNPEANFWVNGCAAQFYQVGTIEAKLP